MRNDLESNTVSHLNIDLNIDINIDINIDRNIDRNIDSLNKVTLELYVERNVLMCL